MASEAQQRDFLTVLVERDVRGGTGRIAAVYFITRLAKHAQHRGDISQYVSRARSELADTVLEYATVVKKALPEKRLNEVRHELKEVWHEFAVRVAALMTPEMYGEIMPHTRNYDASCPKLSETECAILRDSAAKLVENSAYDVLTLQNKIVRVDLNGGARNFERVGTALRNLWPAGTPEDTRASRTETASAFVEHMCGKFLGDTLEKFEQAAVGKMIMADVLMDMLVQELELHVMLLAFGQNEVAMDRGSMMR